MTNPAVLYFSTFWQTTIYHKLKWHEDDLMPCAQLHHITNDYYYKATPGVRQGGFWTSVVATGIHALNLSNYSMGLLFHCLFTIVCSAVSTNKRRFCSRMTSSRRMGREWSHVCHQYISDLPFFNGGWLSYHVSLFNTQWRLRLIVLRVVHTA